MYLIQCYSEGRLEANHVIDKSHVWVGGISQG